MADEYSRAIARIATGQLAELAGYESVQESAIDVLAELLLRYMSDVATGSHSYAELGQRTDINVYDVLSSLDDMGTSLENLQDYLATLSPEDNMFAHSVSNFPVRKPGRSMPTFQEKQEEAPAHVPSFLPAFPDKHTLIQTPKHQGHEQDPSKQVQAVKQDGDRAKHTLIKLHQSLCNTSAAIDASTSNNPFLQTPEFQTIQEAPQTSQQQGPDQQGAGSNGQHASFQGSAASSAFKAVLELEGKSEVMDVIMWKETTITDKPETAKALEPFTIDYTQMTKAKAAAYAPVEPPPDAFGADDPKDAAQKGKRRKDAGTSWIEEQVKTKIVRMDDDA